MFIKCIVIFTIINSKYANGIHERIKRFIPYPEFAPTRIQFIAGMGLPVDLELESVTIGYVFKALYTLPDNITFLEDFASDPFSPITRPLNGGGKRRRRRRRQLLSHINDREYDQMMQAENDKTVERYEVEPIEIFEETSSKESSSSSSNDDHNTIENPFNDDIDTMDEWMDNEFLPDDRKQNMDTTRWSFYKGIAKMIEMEGMPGRSCVLRSICESAQIPFAYHSGILGELAHIIMTPTTTNDKLYQHSDNEYFRAEKLGKYGEPCDKIFGECKQSIIDQYSGVYNPMMLEKLIKTMGI